MTPDLQLGVDESRLDGPCEEAVAEESGCGSVVDPGVEVLLFEFTQFDAVVGEPVDEFDRDRDRLLAP